MPRSAVLLALIVLALTTAVAPRAGAAESTRVLNGHEFMPSETVPSPFAVSFFGTRTGGGLAFDLKCDRVVAGQTGLSERHLARAVTSHATALVRELSDARVRRAEWAGSRALQLDPRHGENERERRDG